MQELASLIELADDERASQMAAYHKVDRRYLGLRNPRIDELVASWRARCSTEQRVLLAAQLWDSNIHEARIAAAKLLTQARLRPDDDAWQLIAAWTADFDGCAIADAAMIAGQKRVTATPARLDLVEGWLNDQNMWTRRAALTITLPWAKMNNPKPRDLETRERVLGWAGQLTQDRDWFIQKAIAWWLRDLSKRDAGRVMSFLDRHEASMKPFARREARRLIQDL
ncbi:DNA alkylation repair protein [Paracoccus sp. Z330]|uniref:DNA alkylation repair protein n=1 Tax=Paracoccus onchidii TaxID=3017813 RepID=A0ABT4ZEL2_9RHOB|nr:DNA alkylation repair protein [Paracoccus onchidii]MDB6177809.1 DNA alkylation repair protein [Paracoccus onchidii]